MDQQLLSQTIRQLKLTSDDLKREIIKAKAGDVEVVLNGDLKVLDIIAPGHADPGMIKNLKEALNKAIEEAQKQALDSVKKIAKRYEK